MRLTIALGTKRLIFDSDLRGLRINGKEYVSGRDGILIYDQTEGVRADEVELQMSTNTSTLIPALRALAVPYHPYFDERPVVESQNHIAFYWKPTKLAAFYNRFSTDELTALRHRAEPEITSDRNPHDPDTARNVRPPALIGARRTVRGAGWRRPRAC